MSRKPVARLCLLVLISLLHSALTQQRRKALEFIRPNQVFEISDAAATFGTAARNCVNDAWAAAVATAVRQQHIKLSEKDWSVRLAGGDACLQTLPGIHELKRSVEGDYSLADGKRIRISLNYQPGPPTSADPLAVELGLGRPPIAIYKGRPLLLYGVTCDEHIINNLHKEIWITELRLIDPTAKPSTEKRALTIKRDEDTVAGIEGIIRIRIAPIELMQMDSDR